MTDGSAAIAVGGLIAGTFATETAKTVMTGEKPGRFWFAVAVLAGLAVMGLGFWLRHRSRMGLRVGIIVNAVDAHRGSARAEQRNQQAERFSQNSAAVTLKAEIALSDDPSRDRELVDLLAEETLRATTIAERLAPEAAHVNLIPTMPLHVAFWLGARLGHTHAQHVAVHELRQNNGSPAFFAATSLRTLDGKAVPLTVERPQMFDAGDATKVAIALDLQNRGDQFRDAVAKACREHGIGWLLLLRNENQLLKQDMKTFNAVVTQTCNEWYNAVLPPAARTGHHAIFLSGPVAIAVALGARLAAPSPGQWTAYTFNPTESVYVPFPAPPKG
ncbi:hypothetical protein SAMN05421748_102321 [Paractinoplanes atraurantiacus]|uniref:SAVED domain-containing protein n=2 Tax=Paractinoplanes atraurantiacus TaxID=1036182 RepID=A0A285GPI2_9ACTN|nr:hypothetical protein SAMN05421748_102321 [Actinoplanes atraurantiacus]